MDTRRVLFWSVFTCLLSLVLPVLFVFCALVLPARYDETFLGELPVKCALLDEAPSPRIVLVGGSSLAFGVDSAALQAAFPGYTVVNFGLYAALGTPMMLDLSAGSLRAGDLVLISPEQQAQTISCYFNAEAAWQALDGHPALLARLGRENWGAMAGQLPAFAAAKLRYTLLGARPRVAGIYRRASFNAAGDISVSCPANVMPGGYDANTPIVLDSSELSADFIRRLNRYAEAAQARGATVWYRFCPMNAAAILPGSDADGYFDALQSQLSFPVIGSPQGCIFAANWFYDTNFHLNTAGRQANTRQLVRDIKAMRMDATPTVLPMPDMPALPAEGGQTPETAADDPDADCFVCELQSDGAAVTGLTDTGRTRTELTLPTRFQGRAVTSLAAGAFAGNTVIRQINVPGSFRTIADRSFAGCTALRVIRLQNRDPAACLVGQNLLADTSAELWVDADVLDAYKLHYFWAVYAGRLAAAPSGRG